MTLPACFKAYDIRGRIPDQLDETLAWRIGRAYAALWQPRQVAVGRDVRLSSEALAGALVRGLREAGCGVLDLGLCCTEEVYFAASASGMDGGIMVTASHNPVDHNGMKLVRGGAQPVSGDSGLHELGRLAASGDFAPAPCTGGLRRAADREAYISHLLGWVDTTALRPLKVVANPGNGCAGPVLQALAPHLPLELVLVHGEPDGHFPNGIPNPLLPENRRATAEAVQRHGADLGLAWDGDADRCFLFNERGDFVEGYYVVGLLAEIVLARCPGGRVVHDPRLWWNTVERVRHAGGIPVLSKTGHAFIKERMRREDAVYGGEMSAHHYFRDFAYCDSGMIPWLLVVERMSREGLPLSALVRPAEDAYPCSGEINFTVADAAVVLDRIEQRLGATAIARDATDGLSLEFADWRFNVRASNTEPLLRLNVETRGDRALLQRRTAELAALVDG